MTRPSEHDTLRDPPFDESLRDLLRNSESDIDFVSVSRLRAARARAVDAARRPGRGTTGWWTVPGAAVSALALAWLLVSGRLMPPLGNGGGAAAVPQVEVIETLADDKTNGVYDDIEFYQWLAETDDHG